MKRESVCKVFLKFLKLKILNFKLRIITENISSFSREIRHYLCLFQNQDNLFHAENFILKNHSVIARTPMKRTDRYRILVGSIF